MFGYALAFGEGSQFIGYTHFGLIGLPFEDFAFLFFQVVWIIIKSKIFDFFLLQSTFAATCATIVSGAIAERCNFNGYILFSIVMTGIVYPIHAHWCWGGGWLAQT